MPIFYRPDVSWRILGPRGASSGNNRYIVYDVQFFFHYLYPWAYFSAYWKYKRTKHQTHKWPAFPRRLMWLNSSVVIWTFSRHDRIWCQGSKFSSIYPYGLCAKIISSLFLMRFVTLFDTVPESADGPGVCTVGYLRPILSPYLGAVCTIQPLVHNVGKLLIQCNSGLYAHTVGI